MTAPSAAGELTKTSPRLLQIGLIPPNDNYPPSTAACPMKTIPKEMQHTNKILGKFSGVLTGTCGTTRPPRVSSLLDASRMKNPPKNLQWRPLPTTFEFDNMIWTTNNDMPIDHKLMADNIATAKSLPKELILSAPMKNKSTLEWQPKSPASGQQKPTPEWQTKSPALRQPSPPMAQKSTPKWQMMSLALGHPSAPMAQKSTP